MPTATGSLRSSTSTTDAGATGCSASWGREDGTVIAGVPTLKTSVPSALVCADSFVAWVGFSVGTA